MENNHKIIQWYPGHMAKARRQMLENINQVDAVLEVVDCRIPRSSSNPDFEEMFQHKIRLTALNKSDMADTKVTQLWENHYKSMGIGVVSINATNKGQKKKLLAFLNHALKEKIQKSQNRGYKKSLRLMVAGIPNSGKSTVINMLAPKASAKAGNRPGVTRGQQIIRINDTIELVDTPGVLWPKFEDDMVGLHLAMTGAIKDEILDKHSLALMLIKKITQLYPTALDTRYSIDLKDKDAEEIIEEIARKRGLLISGGRIDIERCSVMLLTEFRAAKMGKISLERPND
ncbi:MAG: ribosome biogenesis GTPase YlqF [Clostridiales bacterium]|nr:ribosome biogenesis GTPase YlqF [Clostridiales bacterium]